MHWKDINLELGVYLRPKCQLWLHYRIPVGFLQVISCVCYRFHSCKMGIIPLAFCCSLWGWKILHQSWNILEVTKNASKSKGICLSLLSLLRVVCTHWSDFGIFTQLLLIYHIISNQSRAHWMCADVINTLQESKTCKAQAHQDVKICTF